MRAVVFDFGAVLFRWRPRVLLARTLPHRVGNDQAAQRLVADFFQGYGGDWGEFDRGAIDTAMLAQRIAARTGLAEAEVHAVVDAMPDEMAPLPGSVALLERLHDAGRALYYLSNMPEPVARWLESRHHFIRLFRRGVFSSRVGLVKPERAIFEHAAEHFGHAPDRLFFIDDHAPNVEAARAAGWDAVQFLDAPGLEAALERRGLLA